MNVEDKGIARVLGRALARELSESELSVVAGGNGGTSVVTCSAGGADDCGVDAGSTNRPN